MEAGQRPLIIEAANHNGTPITTWRHSGYVDPIVSHPMRVIIKY
jgi:hypothetical protein